MHDSTFLKQSWSGFSTFRSRRSTRDVNSVAFVNTTHLWWNVIAPTRRDKSVSSTIMVIMINRIARASVTEGIIHRNLKLLSLAISVPIMISSSLQISLSRPTQPSAVSSLYHQCLRLYPCQRIEYRSHNKRNEPSYILLTRTKLNTH